MKKRDVQFMDTGCFEKNSKFNKIELDSNLLISKQILKKLTENYYLNSLEKNNYDITEYLRKERQYTLCENVGVTKPTMITFQKFGFTYESLNELLATAPYNWVQNFIVEGDKDSIDNYDKRYREEASKVPWLNNNNSYILESTLEVKIPTLQFKVLETVTFYLENEDLIFEELKNRIIDKDSKEFLIYLVYCSERSFYNCIEQNKNKYSWLDLELEQDKEIQKARCINQNNTYFHITQNYEIILQVNPNYGI
jgi:hypothetical protein